MKPGDEVIIRIFGGGSKARVVTVCADGDLICERTDETLPAWVPRIGRFEARDVHPRPPEKEGDGR